MKFGGQGFEPRPKCLPMLLRKGIGAPKTHSCRPDGALSVRNSTTEKDVISIFRHTSAFTRANASAKILENIFNF